MPINKNDRFFPNINYLLHCDKIRRGHLETHERIENTGLRIVSLEFIVENSEVHPCFPSTSSSLYYFSQGKTIPSRTKPSLCLVHGKWAYFATSLSQFRTVAGIPSLCRKTHPFSGQGNSNVGYDDYDFLQVLGFNGAQPPELGIQGGGYPLARFICIP